jgi:pimeloyl-ACP methyl ester carboxylesterase
MAGHGDKVVGNRQAKRLHAAIPGSVLHIVEGVGHMVHHVAFREVAEAVADVQRRAGGEVPIDRLREPRSSEAPVAKAA